MKSIANLSHFKTPLLCLALACALGGCYYVARYRSRVKQHANLQTRLAKAQEQIQLADNPQVLLAQVKQLQTRIKARQYALADETQTSSGSKGFASHQSGAAVQAMNLKLSELAAASGVRIPRRSPYVWPEKTEPSVATSTAGDQTESGPFLDEVLVRELFGESLQQLELESSFAGLHAFVRGLDQLPWPVVVVQLEIATSSIPGAARPELKTKLIVAM